MLFAGAAVNAAAVVIAAVAVGYLFYKDKHDSIIMLFLFVLILGDSRVQFFQFVKSLRIEVLMFMFAISLFELRNRLYKVNLIMLYFVPFLSVALLALIFSPLLELGLSKTLSFTIFYFVAFNYINHKLQRYGIQLMIDVLYLIVALLALGFLLMPVFPEYVSYGGVRFNGVMGNPNGMGMLLTLTTPIAAYLFKKHPFPRRFKTFVWLLIGMSLLMCSSRNAIFSIAVFGMLLFGLAGGSFRRIIFIFVFLPSMAIFFYNVDLETIFISLGLEKYFRVKELESGSGRIFAWQHAFELIQQAPLIGCGFACEEYHFVYRTTFQLWHSGHQGGVHNSYLAYAINTGVVGATFFMGFLINAARMVRNWRFLIPFIASAFFSAIFESWLFSSLS
ncbi:MAG TPA: O-antigen ligase family protein, partial [Bacteroidia bacterium]|nr:O-antigen ligase family protein [Bacteroidia bacterium]